MALGDRLPFAARFILIAMFFDFFDGLVARLKKATTKFGQEYDSLADLVSFGVAPAIMIYLAALRNAGRLGMGVVFIYVACTALRLARFNIQKVSVQKRYFLGMPTPAAAGCVASVLLFNSAHPLPFANIFLPLLAILLSFLMVSTFKYPAIGMLNLSKKKPFINLVIVILCGAIALFQLELFLLLCFSAYLVLGLIGGRRWEEEVAPGLSKSGWENTYSRIDKGAE